MGFEIMKMGHQISNSRIETNRWWAKKRTNQLWFFRSGGLRGRGGLTKGEIAGTPERVCDVGKMRFL
jgi:hypothetical protein